MTDPAVSGNPVEPRLTQSFDLEANQPGVIRAYYTDRRGHTWEYHYHPPEAPLGYPEADILIVVNPLQEYRVFDFDAERNLDGYQDGLFNCWDYTYDDRGNMLTTTDPLDHVKTWTYDEYNNVTSYTDPGGNTVEFRYDLATPVNVGVYCVYTLEPTPCGVCVGGSHPGTTCDGDADCEGGTCQPDEDVCTGSFCVPFGQPCTTDDDCGEGESCVPEWCQVGQGPTYPTLLTRIIEPPDGQGNPAATTTLSYDSGGTGSVDGLLYEVRDPNNVWTHFDYDRWGQPALYEEGESPSGGGVVGYTYAFDSAGRLVSSGLSPGGGRSPLCEAGGAMSYDANGRPTDSTCWMCREGEDPEPPLTFPPLPNVAAPIPPYAEWTVPRGGWSPRDELLEMNVSVRAGGGSSSRDYTAAYDKLGRQTSSAIKSYEYTGAAVTRGFSYRHDWSTGRYWRTGPDGVETYVELDKPNRVFYMRRGGAEANPPLLEAWYHYYENGLLWHVDYGNWTSTWYEYDDAHRLTSIDHRDAVGDTMRKLEYAYTDNDLVSGITEHGALGVVAVVSFGYDDRGRLISEVRTGTSPYNLSYTYDPGGNRTMKVDRRTGNERYEVEYHYDLEAPLTYGSNNNRLMEYWTYHVTPFVQEKLDMMGEEILGGEEMALESLGFGGVREQRTLISKTWYYYNNAGNVTRVVSHQSGTDSYEAVWLGYARNKQTIVHAAGETWQWDGNPTHSPTNRQVQWAREFRYDGARQRYLNRVLDPDYLELGGIRPMPGVAPVWSDYDGDEIYGDFTVNDGVVTNERSFELGLAKVDPWTDSGGANTQYYHTDMIGTTRFMSDSGGTGVSPVVYTAFGERVCAIDGSCAPDDSNPRYGYAGAWGYQAHDEFPFLHVGHRYYDPATGRFLQRDPIGIRGGMNVYLYLSAAPADEVDPLGLQSARPGPLPPGPPWRPPVTNQ